MLSSPAGNIALHLIHNVDRYCINSVRSGASTTSPGRYSEKQPMSTLNPVTLRTKEHAYWGGIFAMTLCVFVLIASEFMPVSLLTPIAKDLAVTEGWQARE